MSDHDTLDERLRAVERALTDDDRDLPDLSDAAELTREVESLAERLDAIEERLDRLDGATQALRGYVGNVRAVNESVERKADVALEKAEALASQNRESDNQMVAPGTPDTRTHKCEQCECAVRRPTEPVAATGESDVIDGDSGGSDGESADECLLARVAESLSRALTGSSGSR